MAKPRKNLNNANSLDLYFGSIPNPEEALPEGVEGKLSIDTGEGKKLLQDVFLIPCDRLSAFSLKEEEDFSPWPEEKFEELVVSVKELGVLHPIVVRPILGTGGRYEILAGEHRWKASKQLGTKTIPARILSDCSDEKARSVFTLTNILSRELTLMDKIQGWSKYYEVTKGKTFEEIQELRKQGVLEETEKQDISKRQIYRYHRINSLCLPLKEMIAEGKISQKDGEGLTLLSQEEQTLLANYKDKITSSKAIKEVLALKNLEIEGYDFDKEGLEFVLSTKKNPPKEGSFSNAMAQARLVLKKRLAEEDYPRSGQVLEKALQMYHAFGGELELAQKALEEYHKNHPEGQ